VAGKVAVVAQESGTVFVRLPNGTGFVSLKGVASVPIGSIVDARAGTISITTAADGRTGGNRRVQAGQFSAAIFRLRQTRAQRAASRPQTDIVLLTPAGQARACVAARGKLRHKVVRTLRGRARGRFRTIAGASITRVSSATWITQDRCDGTLTRVIKGRARVLDRNLHRTISVAAGRTYLTRARLFGAQRHRHGT
jgi:hypothetical protein